eukprot:s3480_g3.t1
MLETQVETLSLLSQCSQQTPNEPPFLKLWSELILQRLFKGLWRPKSLLLPPAFGAAGKVEIHPSFLGDRLVLMFSIENRPKNHGEKLDESEEIPPV